MKAAELLVKCLETEGVKYIFGVPGEENLELVEAIRTSSIKLVVTRHEQSAVFMAATMGRLTGKAGVALSTLGPGATNLVTGVAYAQLGGMPLVVITGQKPIRKSKQGKFQIIDVVRMMQPLTKLSSTIVGAERIPSMVREAFKLAEAERPGAVHLELPEDVASEQTTLKPIEPTKVRRPGPDPKAITAAVEMIEKANHPLVLIAAGANRKLVRKHLKSFLDKTKIPFVTTQMGKGVENESSPLYLGTAALTDNDYVHCALNYADLIIVVGHDITEKPPVILTPDTHKVIHINFSEANVDDVYIPSLEVIGDISHTLWAIGEQIKPQGRWDLSYFERLRVHLQKQLKEKSDSDSFPVKPQRVAADLRSIMPSDGILSLDNGMYKIWLARNYPAYEQNTVILDNALATMGAGLPAGIAAKLVNPDKKVLVVAGDGGLMMTVEDLETAKRLNLDLVVLLLNDEGFGMIRFKQQEMGFADFGLSFGNPDFVKLAESFGAKGYHINKTQELKSILEKALGEKGIHIIDCPIDYSENALVFGKELKEKTCNL
ncbi:MAG TPA: acetolactate synthase large subunit [Patescibacteria group bacterium]|nr:acetolactate synthase large subunit [Patescibacteria group bacterium]